MSAFVITADSAGYGRRDRFSLWMDKVHLSLHREFLRLATFSSLSFTPQSLSSSSSTSSIPAGVRREASHAEELAGTGITATVVHPGLTRTENVDAMIARLAKEQDKTEQEIETGLAASNLVGYLPTSEDVAGVVAFLASPHSHCITSDVIAASGGTRGTIHY